MSVTDSIISGAEPDEPYDCLVSECVRAPGHDGDHKRADGSVIPDKPAVKKLLVITGPRPRLGAEGTEG